jgi:hypothetical protein
MTFFNKAATAWLDNIAEVMERKATPVLQALNPQFRTAARPKWEHGDVDAVELQQLGEFLQAAVGTGAIVPDPALDKWARDQVGAPVADQNLDL